MSERREHFEVHQAYKGPLRNIFGVRKTYDSVEKAEAHITILLNANPSATYHLVRVTTTISEVKVKTIHRS